MTLPFPHSVTDAMQMAERLDLSEPQREPPVPHLIRTHSAETPLRSAAKATTWRIWASLDTFVVAVVVGWWQGVVDWHAIIGAAVAISVGEVLTKTAHYWIHERLWDRINWGLRPRQED